VNEATAIGVSRLDIPAIRAGLVGFCLLFLCMSAFCMTIGRMPAAGLYLVAVLVLGAFLVGVIRTGKYSFGFWQLETAFFLVWIVALRTVGGGFHHGLDASAVVVAVIAVTMGRGFARRITLFVVMAVPVVVKLVEAAWPSAFYFPTPARTAKLGSGIELLAVAAILTVLLDRILAAYFLERRRAEEKAEALSKLVVTDGMTGLANLTGILERLDGEIERAGRYGHPLSVLMIDVDGLKALNDGRGHLAGDEALRAIASVMKATLAAPQLAGRRGGDEFLAVLPEVTYAQAMEIGERIRAGVEGLDLVCGAGRITVSIGVAQFGEGGSTELLDVADSRLYVAKHAGRNTVVGSD